MLLEVTYYTINSCYTTHYYFMAGKSVGRIFSMPEETASRLRTLRQPLNGEYWRSLFSLYVMRNELPDYFYAVSWVFIVCSGLAYSS